jgi:hypothetical protein
MCRSDLSLQFARPETNEQKTVSWSGIDPGSAAKTLEISRQTTTASAEDSERSIER